MVTAAPPRIELPDWALEFMNIPARWKAAYGGRGSGKTVNVASVIVIKMRRQRIRVACVRDYRTNIDESAKQALEEAIYRMGFEGEFTIHTSRITHNETGAEVFFVGVDRNPSSSIKGWEAVDIVWIEEAQDISQKAWDLLLPTPRKKGSELWFTFNPTRRSDPVWKAFCSATPYEGAMVKKINYYDNPWFHLSGLEIERATCEKYAPALYRHIWLGEVESDPSIRKVLPYDLIERCIGAHKVLGYEPPSQGFKHSGLDVADTGPDRNSWAFRNQALLSNLEVWDGMDTYETAVVAHNHNELHRVSKMYFDGTGVGSGIRAYMNHHKRRRAYAARPVNFGGKVKNPQRPFTHSITNEEMFQSRNSQLGWALRIRAENTNRAVRKEAGVNLKDCLFIAEDIEDMDNFLIQLSQPEWTVNRRGRMVIEKRPENAPSPDKYDASILAFAHDSDYGLKLHPGIPEELLAELNAEGEDY